MENPKPEYLYKILSPKKWQESLQQKQVVLDSADNEFIHLSKEDQLSRITQKYWNAKDHVILKLSVDKLVGNLIFEANSGGENKYYHLYEGSIPLDAVLETLYSTSF